MTKNVDYFITTLCFLKELNDQLNIKKFTSTKGVIMAELLIEFEAISSQ